MKLREAFDFWKEMKLGARFESLSVELHGLSHRFRAVFRRRIGAEQSKTSLNSLRDMAYESLPRRDDETAIEPQQARPWHSPRGLNRQESIDLPADIYGLAISVATGHV